jgi:hypothetical protein
MNPLAIEDVSNHRENQELRTENMTKPWFPADFVPTPEARVYALGELARRAGVSPDFYRTWAVEVTPQCTRITFRSVPRKSIVFWHAAAEWWAQMSAPIPVAYAGWMFTAPKPVTAAIPSFVVPFAPPKFSGSLFRTPEPNQVTCDLDLLASILLNLSRVEELLNPDRDEHGRFPASRSAAFHHGYCDRPVVDEYGFAFEQALSYLFPAWQPMERRLKLKLTHDIDVVGQPFDMRAALGHTLRRGAPLAGMRDTLAPFTGILPAYLQCTLALAKLAREYGLPSAMYWKAAAPTRFDSGYDIHDAKLAGVIRALRAEGVEHGVHPGYYTFHDPDLLEREVKTLQTALGETSTGGRQHYLRWSPSTWAHWDRCGLFYDSSVGYSELVGFRSGTCHPYHPWLFHMNREANLLEIPLVVMDVSLTEGMGLRGLQCIPPVFKCIERCKMVGGVFTLLWHNNSLLERWYGNIYPLILQRLAGGYGFELTANDRDCSIAEVA